MVKVLRSDQLVLKRGLELVELIKSPLEDHKPVDMGRHYRNALSYGDCWRVFVRSGLIIVQLTQEGRKYHLFAQQEKPFEGRRELLISVRMAFAFVGVDRRAQLKKKAVAMRENGATLREISEKLKTPRSTIDMMVNERQHKRPKPRPRKDSILDNPKAAEALSAWGIRVAKTG